MLEFVTIALGVTALFHYVPNTHVRWRHALIGGIFVAFGFAAAKRLLALYFGTVPTYAVVYGVFATVPIFLIWIYLSWIVVLLGAVIAAYAPVAGTHIVRRPEAPGSSFHLGVEILRALQAAKTAGRNGMTDSELSETLGVDPLQIGPLLDRLTAIDWVGKLDETGNPRYVVLVDEHVSAEPLLAALLLEPSPEIGPFWQQAGSTRCAWPRCSTCRASPEPRLQPPGAARRAAPAGELAAVVRLAVVDGQLLAGSDVAHRVELDPPLANAQHGVRRAGMVGEAQRVGRRRGIDRAPFAHLHDHDPGQPAGPLPGFPHRDRFAADLADLAARRDRFRGEGALAVDRTRADVDPELLRVGGRALGWRPVHGPRRVRVEAVRNVIE